MIQTRGLLIEDNNIQARATQTCLEQEHDVVVETSVEDAHARFDAADFDLIIALIGDSQARMDSASCAICGTIQTFGICPS